MGMEIFTESGIFKPSAYGLPVGSVAQIICVGGGGGGGHSTKASVSTSGESVPGGAGADGVVIVTW